MGCSNSRHDQENNNNSKKIDEQIKKDKKVSKKEIKLLLLGAGECGKSTILKQMKIIYMKGFTERELLNYKAIVHNNFLNSIQTLITAAKLLEYQFDNENLSICEEVAKINALKCDFTQQELSNIKAMWKDTAIQNVWGRVNEFQILEVAEYLLHNIDRITDINYVPTLDDCLRCRSRTTGVVEINFVHSDVTFKVVDVGGQRTERRKWIHCFENVTAVIFCASLIEYDQQLYEDNKINRMMESLSLFEQTCQTKWFDKSSIILFLNKSDLFREKILKKDIKCCFPDYDGGCDFLNATQFIEQKFLQRNMYNKSVYTHITCATDTNNIKFVFAVVRDMIMNKYLSETGFA